MKIYGFLFMIFSLIALIFHHFNDWDVTNAQVLIWVTFLFALLFLNLVNPEIFIRKLIRKIVDEKIKNFAQQNGIDYKSEDEKEN